MRIVGLLFMCSLCEAAGVNGADNTLVELVKLNLRRNNDDYGDANRNAMETTSTIKNKVTSARRVLFIEVSKDGYSQKETPAEMKTEMEKEALTTESKKQTRNKLQESKVTKATETNNEKVKKGVRNRIETFEKFIMKNKDLVKGYVSKKFEPTHNIMRQSVILTANKTKPNFSTRTINLTPLRQFGQRQKKVGRHGEMPGVSAPDPVLLDMAPAKGARIENKRLKGRLCDRSVLAPEGPQYDGRGRPYHVVRPPADVVLPRCCNCCRKSVLGCE